MQTDPAKFVIVTHPRCGSHMLASALESRGDVVCDSEPFNATSRPYGYEPYQKVLDDVFDVGNPGVLAAGFILHRRGQGCAGQPGEGIWDHLMANDASYKIIMLHRANHLERHVSDRIAWRTKLWRTQHPQYRTRLRIDVDYDELIADIDQYNELWFDNMVRFSPHTVLPVVYEELCDATYQQHRYAEIQLFLGLTPTPLTPKYVKQEQRPVHKAINNFYGLMNKMAAGPYAHHRPGLIPQRLPSCK